MAKYELSDEQVKNVKAIMADANIKGATAPVIVDLLRALSSPVVEKKEQGGK